jgi:hypothetical protein
VHVLAKFLNLFSSLHFIGAYFEIRVMREEISERFTVIVVQMMQIKVDNVGDFDVIFCRHHACVSG